MTLIVAEVGSNYTNFTDAKDSISMAKNCGADIVKFQMFTHEELYGFSRINLSKMCKEIREWLPALSEKATAVGIELMVSTFSPEGLAYANSFVSRHKIASSDLTYPQLLSAAKGSGKPLILSTGASSLVDIGTALELLSGHPITLLHCVSAYPAKNVNLDAIRTLRDTFKVEVGYSCHTNDLHTAVHAVKHYGAVVIEKHFKLRDMETPDAPHSLNPDEFKEMVDRIRGKRTDVQIPSKEELPMLIKYNRRLIATVPIAKGEPLEYGKNFGCFRSLKADTKGLSGFAYQFVNGKKAKVNFQPGDSVGPLEIG